MEKRASYIKQMIENAELSNSVFTIMNILTEIKLRKIKDNCRLIPLTILLSSFFTPYVQELNLCHPQYSIHVSAPPSFLLTTTSTCKHHFLMASFNFSGSFFLLE